VTDADLAAWIVERVGEAAPYGLAEDTIAAVMVDAGIDFKGELGLILDELVAGGQLYPRTPWKRDAFLVYRTPRPVDPAGVEAFDQAIFGLIALRREGCHVDDLVAHLRAPLPAIEASLARLQAGSRVLQRPSRPGWWRIPRAQRRDARRPARPPPDVEILRLRRST
jgi:hypothetical protein